MKQFDRKTIQEALDNKWVYEQKHPTLPIFLYKYTQECVFRKHWNEFTLSARGLVLDENGYVVANPMRKFFNWEEHTTEDREEMLNCKQFKVFEKLDGTCVEVFKYGNNLVVCTLGSFVSEHSKIALELLNTKYKHIIPHIEPNVTLQFEMLTPQNRIVVSYGDTEGLYLLSARVSNDIGGMKADKEIDINEYRKLGFDVAPSYDMTFEQLLAEKVRPDFINKEGFVLLFDDGSRVKFKYEEYFRLHKLVTGINEHFVWEFLSLNKDIPLENLPDEFMEDIEQIKFELECKYLSCEIEMLQHYERIFTNTNPKNKKEFAIAVVNDKNAKSYSDCIFKKWDKREYSDLLWKKIEPKGSTLRFNSLKKENK